jgi:RING-box protein 1
MFTISSASIVSASLLNIHNDVCPICRLSLEDKCIECMNDNKSSQLSGPNTDEPSKNECKSVLGICNHGYHLHCINTWIKTKNICPLDNTKWEFQKHSCKCK